jgi:hypothetical protein
MSAIRFSPITIVLLIAAARPAAVRAQAAPAKTAAPARSTVAKAATNASGTLTIGGKSFPLAHALAYDAGASKLILITEQVVPREKVKSEVDLMKYNFDHQPTGVILWLDSANKMRSASYMSQRTMVDVTSGVELTLANGPAGSLSGSAKSKPGAKVKLDVNFNASTKP